MLWFDSSYQPSSCEREWGQILRDTPDISQERNLAEVLALAKEGWAISASPKRSGGGLQSPHPQGKPSRCFHLMFQDLRFYLPGPWPSHDRSALPVLSHLYGMLQLQQISLQPVTQRCGPPNTGAGGSVKATQPDGGLLWLSYLATNWLLRVFSLSAGCQYNSAKPSWLCCVFRHFPPCPFHVFQIPASSHLLQHSFPPKRFPRSPPVKSGSRAAICCQELFRLAVSQDGVLFTCWACSWWAVLHLAILMPVFSGYSRYHLCSSRDSKWQTSRQE